jgi:hypothetical protein
MLVKLTKALESDGSLQHAQQGHVVEGYRKNFARTSGVNFTNILRTAFALVDPKSVKNTVKSSVSFYAFGIYKCKSCT